MLASMRMSYASLQVIHVLQVSKLAKFTSLDNKLTSIGISAPSASLQVIHVLQVSKLAKSTSLDNKLTSMEISAPLQACKLYMFYEFENLPRVVG